MEIFGRFWAMILGFLLIFAVPFYFMEMRKSMVNEVRVMTEADRFLDHIRYCGYLEKEDMNQFMLKMTGSRGLKKITLLHRRRVVKPMFEGKEICETKEFYLETGYEEIKEILEKRGRYHFYTGDEITLVIEDESKHLPLLGGDPIVMGGMIENELATN